MKIGVDALPLMGKMSRGTGITKYIYPLLKLLFETDKENTYRLYFRTPMENLKDIAGYFDPEFHSVGIEYKKMSIPNRLIEFFWIRHRFLLPDFITRFSDLDIFFSTCYVVPVFKKSIVSVIYDLTPLKLPDLFAATAENFKIKLDRIIESSSFFIAISENTKRDFLEYSGVSPEKVSVVYPGVEERFCPQDDIDIERVKEKYGINEKYILYTGIISPHKNVQKLIDAFYLLKKKFGIPHKLVLTGRSIAGYKLNFIEKRDIILTDYIPDEDVPALYSGADVFVFLSLYEGFGLPVLEAMACGCPVVSSNTSSMPEVIGDAGMLVSPKDTDEIAGSIYTVLNSPRIKNELSRKSVMQAKKFRWEESAEKVSEIFRRIKI
jgi:glycosyltransferase involved in cell wall biosynthesis